MLQNLGTPMAMAINEALKSGIDRLGSGGQLEPAIKVSDGLAASANPSTFFANGAEALASVIASYAPEASIISGIHSHASRSSYVTLSVGQK